MEGPNRKIICLALSIYRETQERLVSELTTQGNITINNLELVELLTQIQSFALRMQPLSHIHTMTDSMSAQGWEKRGSISLETAVGPIIRDLDLLIRS